MFSGKLTFLNYVQVEAGSFHHRGTESVKYLYIYAYYIYL